MKPQTRHTATPWKLNEMEITTVNARFPLAKVIYYEECGKTCKANAHFIVKAVNNHEALVEALKEARQAIRAFTIEKEIYTNPAVNEKVAIEETLPKIESAILNAEKE